MNEFVFREFSVLVDYAHNPHGLLALGAFLNQRQANYKVGIITGVGDRRDEDILELGRIAGGLFDEIIIRMDEDSRGRDTDEISDLLRRGAQQASPNKRTIVIADELKALDYAIRHARPGTLIVHITEKISRSIELVQSFKDLEEKYGEKPEPEEV